MKAGFDPASFVFRVMAPLARPASGPAGVVGGVGGLQAVARDVLVEAMFRAEEAGYPLVLTVHDELICETPDDAEHTEAGLEEIMAVVPEWATGLPVAAGTWEDYRYAK